MLSEVFQTSYMNFFPSMNSHKIDNVAQIFVCQVTHLENVKKCV